jgi:NADH-quinone oxidoreductase subunit L
VADLLWLIPALPLAGFLALLLFGRRLAGRVPALVGCLSVGLSMAASFAAAAAFLGVAPPGRAVRKTICLWFEAGGLAPSFGFYLDGISILMVVVITVVAFLIHVYSADFMAADSSLPLTGDGEGYSRFFAYMNLFVGSMLVLVLADNLLLLYLGWEGVGLCSYLLIGFWYKDPANGRAAVKAFVVTRVGDASLAVGLFIIAWGLGTFDIQEAAARAARLWPEGSAIAIAAAALLLGGAVGKSAQLPLQTWLPDAMAGPTPVSALIHAATMVTAGVYLVGRTHALFALAPPVLTVVAAVGAATFLIAGASALVQRDIKRILAYSTMSQVGYMFCALGVGAWSAAFFHFMTHAFFKALLFMSAGVVIKALDNEHDIFKMGGLRTRLPSAYRGFLVGAASLAALPYLTAGFYSKEMILDALLTSPAGSPWLWAAGLLGAFLTALYAFRAVFVVFFGEGRGGALRQPSPLMGAPLFILSIFAIATGWLLPNGLAGPFLAGLFGALPAGAQGAGTTGPLAALAPPVVAIAGVVLAGLFYLALPRTRRALTGSAAGAAVHRFLFTGWGFDGLYASLFVTPFVRLAKVNRSDIIDAPYRAIGLIAEFSSRGLSLTQSGKVRWYAAAVAIGGAVFLGLAVLL